MSKQLFKSTLVVSSMTLISRLLGFVRDTLIAQLFGVDVATDAFFVAFKIPNFLRRLFAEGAFAHAFVPVLATYKEQGHAPLKRFIAKVTGTLSLCLLLFSILGIVAAPLLIFILAPGFDWQGSAHDIAVLSLQIMLPFLFFISLTALCGSVLNAHQQFAIPAITPVFLNITMIWAALYLAPTLETPVLALAWAVLLAGVMQLVFQLPALWRLSLLSMPRLAFKDTGVKKVIVLMIPAIFSVSVTQINLLLDTLIASLLKAGSVSWLYYSDRLVEFPLGILGLALGTVILPHLSKHHAQDNNEDFSHSLDWGLRLVLVVGLPATVGLIMLAEPMLFTLFQYKEFSVQDVYLSGQSLKAYAVGLIGYLMIKVLVPAFTSRQDVKTPVRYGSYAMGVSLALNILAIPLAHAGLALATSLGAFFNAALLLKKLFKDKVYQPVQGWFIFSLRVVFANVIMAGMLYYAARNDAWQDWTATERLWHLALWISAAIVVYIMALLSTGLKLKTLLNPT